jgi:hypothetical protein
VLVATQRRAVQRRSGPPPMRYSRIIIPLAILLSIGARANPADALKQTSNKRPRVIVRDPCFDRAPPPPHQRKYFEPYPSLQPPMERVPPIAPLSQPPMR